MFSSVFQGPFVHIASICAAILSKFMAVFCGVYEVRLRPGKAAGTAGGQKPPCAQGAKPGRAACSSWPWCCRGIALTRTPIPHLHSASASPVSDLCLATVAWVMFPANPPVSVPLPYLLCCLWSCPVAQRVCLPAYPAPPVWRASLLQTLPRQLDLLVPACAVGVGCCFAAPIGGKFHFLPTLVA